MKKPFAILFTDLHIYLHNVEAVLNIVQQIIDYCKKNHIDRVICLGDVFESRKAQPLLSLKVWEQILLMFNKAQIELFCIPGNHDKVNLTSEDSYLDQYQHWPGFTLLRDYKYYEIKEGVRWHFIPYFNEETTYVNYLNQMILLGKNWGDMKKDGCNYLFTHIGLNTVFNNEGQKISSSIKASMFKTLDKVFIGHYHNKSQVGNNIFYIGSVMPTNFGEDENKGCTILYEDGSHELIQLSFPKFEKVVIDINKFNKEQEQELLKKYSNSQDNIRFEFVGDHSKISAFDKTKFEVVGIDIKTKNKEIEETVNVAQYDEFIEFTNESLLVEFEEFCEVNGIEDKEVGKEFLKRQLSDS